MAWWNNPGEPLPSVDWGQAGRDIGKAAHWLAFGSGVPDIGQGQAPAQQQQRIRDAASEIPPMVNPTPGGAAVPDPGGAAYIQQMMTLYGLAQEDVYAPMWNDDGITVLGEELAGLQTLKEPELENLQRQLLQAGFYGIGAKANSVLWGRWDDRTLVATVNMFKEARRAQASYQWAPGAVRYDEQTGAPAQYSTGLGKPVGWQQYLADAAQAGQEDEAQATTTTTTGTDLSTVGTAHSALKAAMTTLLGRAPRASEVRQFHTQLNEAERANPTVTTTTTSASGETQTSSQEGGITAGDVNALAEQNIGEQFGRERNRFGIFDYTQAFEQAIGG